MTREALARALTGTVGLGESPSHDAAPVDRLHAVGAAQRVETFKDCRDARGASLLSVMGRDLFAHINGDGELWRCEIALANVLRWKEHRLRLDPHMALLVARQAIVEVRNDKCRVCRGRMDSNKVFSIPDVDRMAGRDDPDGPIPMRACPKCGGTGKHKWDDHERELAVPGAATLGRAFSVAHASISGAISQCLVPYRHYLKD